MSRICISALSPQFGWEHWALPWLCVASAFLAGCGGSGNTSHIPDDEPMQRLKWENGQSGARKSAPEAAREYFLPKSYYDPQSAAAEQGPPNYLRGMDRVVANPGAVDSADRPLWLQTPVYPLLDRQGVSADRIPDFQIADPVDTPSEILGRNTWMLWCGGNEAFWDWLCTDSLGFIDLLKVIDTRTRARRFETSGMINEPRMSTTGAPDPHGLWLDEPLEMRSRQWRRESLERDFRLIHAGRHPSQRGLELPHADSGAKDHEAETDPGADTAEMAKYPPPEIYGYSSGVVGLRLFPNPRFTAEAARKWNADRYYTDPDYFNDPHLIRPYRVGVACAFCHASYHPVFPPRDVANPEWENISGNIGAQYLRVRAVFANQLKPDNFIYHILDSQPPGTIDTSLIASDNINNPNTMNSVFHLPQRALMSFRNPAETLSATSAKQPSIWKPGTVPPFYQELFRSQNLQSQLDGSNGNPRFVPRVLLDGADSIGAWGALARVYLNIGTFHQQWIRLHRPVIGFQKQQPFKIEDCEQHSVFWHANQDRVAALRDYFLCATPGMPLAAALVGETAARRAGELNPDDPERRQLGQQAGRTIQSHINLARLARGRRVFARNCVVCHSSIQPESIASILPAGADRDAFVERYQELIARRNQRRSDVGHPEELWEHNPAQWFEDPAYQDWAEAAVETEPFWRLNYLSTDLRIPVTLVRTNSGRAMGTNALAGNMWHDFASDSYQHLPSVGDIEFFNPYRGEGEWDRYQPRHQVAKSSDSERKSIPAGGGGPGFYRVPTLVSIWSTAPLLHNNSLGMFNNDPSVKGRLAAFDDAIRKLLWPERRTASSSYNGATPERLERDRGLIWRTPQETYLHLSGRRVPSLLGSEIGAIMRFDDLFPWLKDIRPVGLPSLLLLLAAYVFLIADAERWRRRAGVAFLTVSAVTFVMAILAPAWLPGIHPILLPAGLLLVVGLVFLSVDSLKARVIVGVALSAAGAVGVLLGVAGSGTQPPMTQRGPLIWMSAIIALAGVTLLLTTRPRQRRTVLGWVLTAGAVAGLIVNLLDANLAGSRLSLLVGPLWIYSLLALAAAVVILAPDGRHLSRYLGYSSLVLSLTVGLVIHFLSGKLGDVRIGPIPAGTPVNLLANLNPDADPKELSRAVKITLAGLAEIDSKHLDDEAARRVLRQKVAPALLGVSKCPDFVMDQGHDFAWFQSMNDDDKECLIELLKTL